MLLLARHGRTDANAGGLLQGRVDHPLDDLGRRQAAAVARSLVDVDVVVSSPLALLVALWGMTSQRLRRQMQTNETDTSL